MSQKLSRLELYVEILKSMEGNQQTRIRDLQKKTNADKTSLVLAMDFLEKQGLIKENSAKVYESTPRGLLVAKFFTERSQVVTQENVVCDVSP